MAAMLVQAKIQDLHEDYIMLAITICRQNLLYLGDLLYVQCVFMALALPSTPDNIVQAINGVINGMSLATLLAWTVDVMVPSESFGGLTNTMGMYGLIRQVLRSLRALTWGVWSGSWPPAANNSPLSCGVRPRIVISCS
jgi:hypothetical protein